MIKEFCLGGNTPVGFYSYYDYLMPQDKSKRIICIKGGPGTGKSTMMKTIGMNMAQRGYDVEMMHCSSDPQSLDGVSVPSLGIALVDGTSPHIVDPKNPGAVDEIVHLGDYWDRESIEKNKNQIIRCNKQLKKLYARAYRYLAAARCFYDDITAIETEAQNPVGAEIEFDGLLSEFAEIPFASKPAPCRKLFATAVTSEGLKSYLDTILTQKTVYTIKNGRGGSSSALMDKILNAAVMRGMYAEAYYCPIMPDSKIDHIVIPAMNLAFTTSTEYHLSDSSDNIIDFSEYADLNLLNAFSSTLRYDEEMFDAMLSKTIGILREAKSLHDELETYYIPYMDFYKISKVGSELEKRLFG